ncbi:hypothetical protein E2320_006348 [Naja naja]|nr:hypothetical protein E2320_006348 [Naja naja]
MFFPFNEGGCLLRSPPTSRGLVLLLLPVNGLFQWGSYSSKETQAGGRGKGEKHSSFPKEPCLVLVVERKDGGVEEEEEVRRPHHRIFCGEDSQLSASPARSHAWILIAMFRLAMEVSSCASLGRDLRHPFLQRPAHWYGFPHHLLWSFRYGPQARRLGLPASLDYLELSNGQRPNVSRLKRFHHVADLWWGSRGPSLGYVKANPMLTGKRTVSQAYLKRRKRYLRANSRPTMETEVIVWGSTSPLEALETSTIPGIYNGPATSVLERVTSSMTTTTTVSTTTAASTTVHFKGLGPGLGAPKNHPISTLLPPSTSGGGRKKAEGPPPPPPKIPGDTSGRYPSVLGAFMDVLGVFLDALFSMEELGRHLVGRNGMLGGLHPTSDGASEAEISPSLRFEEVKWGPGTSKRPSAPISTLNVRLKRLGPHTSSGDIPGSSPLGPPESWKAKSLIFSDHWPSCQ